MRFVFIDSDITDIPSIVSAFTTDVHHYVFDWNVDTISVLKDKLTQDYESVGIIQHNKYTSTYKILSNTTNSLVTNVKIEDPDLLTWTEFIEFLQWMYTNSNITAVDLFACELWNDDNWKYIIQTIQDKYNIHIRASINITGEGGDFILESDNFNTIGVYFTEDILQYRYAFPFTGVTSEASLNTSYRLAIPGTDFSGGNNTSLTNTFTINGQTYITTSSSFLNSYSAFNMFRNITNDGNVFWSCSTNGSFGYNRDPYDGNGNYINGGTGNITTNISGTNVLGEWIQIYASNAFILKGFLLHNRAFNYNIRGPRDFYVAGSTNGTTWTGITNQSDTAAPTPDSQIVAFNLPTNTVSYNYYRLVANKLFNGSVFNLTRWNLYTNLDMPVSPNSVSMTVSGTTATVTVTDTNNSTTNSITYWHYLYSTSDVSNNSNNIDFYTSGPVFTSSPRTFTRTISNAGTYTIYVIAKNTQGNSAPVASSAVNVFAPPLTPRIDAVNTKSISTGTIRVFLTDSSNSAFNNVYYHYSTNGSTYTNSNVLFTGNGNYQFDVSGLTTQTTTYTIYVRAQNSAGNSNAVSTSPLHVFGNLPVISSVSPVLGAPMNLRVLHSQTPFKGTSPVTYFYSRNSDGSNRTAATDSSFVITDASQTTTIYVIASNSAGNLISAGVSGTPYLLGDKPTIDSITPSIGNLVTVNFTQSNVGNGNPVYYYGFQGSGVRTDASAVSSPLVIRNLTNTTPYSIYLVARNEAGDISSNSYSGVNVLGSKPVITGITKNIGNSVTVAFTQSQKGTDTTIYYYSLDGTNVSLDASATASPIIIPGLTNDTSYNISIVANNPAGNVFSDASTGITILGEQISLTAVAVENIDKTVRLTYTQTNKGTLPVMYYYTTVNNVNTTALTAFPADSNTVDISNVSETTTYYAISSNSAGNIISTGATVTPNTLGDIPTISAVPVLNSPGVVRLEYLQSNAGNAVTTYFYSTSSNKDTTSKTIFSTNPIDVSGVTELTTYYVIASSSAGNVISSGTSVTPYLLGSNPTISDIIPSVGNSITVTFTQTNPGVDAPIYYYSFDGSSVSLDASATVSPLVITGLTNTTPPYTIYLVAKNNAGNIFSDAFSGVNILGTEPTIGTITKNIGNSVTVSFTQLQKGTDTTVYYGSTDGFTAILDASSSSSNEPLTIRNLNNASPYSIYLIARNPAGDVPSIVSSGIHILGTKPVITNITRNIGNSITVDFTQSQKGTDTTVYYGSIDGTNAILDASSSGTSLTIPNLTDVSAYNISIIARNPAGDVVSDPSLNVSILGTQPSFTLVPQTNNLRGTITQTQKGTLPVTYYYSSDGINKEFEVSFPTFNISGTTSRTFYIIVDNSAGQVVSSPVSETPFTFGTIPSISSVIPGYQTLTVNFSQDQTGTTPVKYYYSYNPSGTTRIAEVNPPFFNISGTQPRTVYIVVDNSAGTLVSEGVSGTPYIFGTTPLITLIQRGSQKITVTFTQTSKGTEPVKYYYSFDRVNRISEVTTNTFDILYEVDSRIGNKTYNVAVSEGLYSFSGDASGNNPNFTVVKGSILTFNVNSLGHPLWIKTSNITGTDYAVTTDISNNGTQSGTIVWNTSNVETGTYYYICQYHSSMFGSITIIHPENNPLTTAKNVSIIADNSAGTLVSDDVSGTPYTFGSVPVIQSVTPGPNKLTVLFSQDTLGNTPSSYSYSFDASGTNPTAIDSSNTIIVNGSQPRTIYVIATNLAGSLISTGVSGTPFVVGDTPSIDDVVAGPYSLTVKFSQQNAGNTPVTYYYSYSVDGSNPQGPVSLPEFTVTASTQTTIYVVADSLSGYLVSSGFTKTPFVFGDNPVINDPIVPGAETLTVSFTQSPKGTEPVTYYYSFLSDGSGRIGPVTSPFTISTTITRTIYVVASNLAGNLVSSGKTATPYTFANEPVITDIVPSPYNLKVYFTPSTTGTTPITYYYSEFENGSNPVGPVTSPFDISGSIERTIYIIADNSAGNVVSIGFTRKPYIFGTVPVIDSIVPGPNKMTVSFTSSVNGTEPVYHYYSYDSSGSNGVLTTSPFVITGTSTRTVYIVANNPAGNLVSTGVSGTPFIVGGIPIIESVISQTNNLRVTFSHPEPGNTAVTYYYSNDASGNNLIEQVNLPTFDISGTVTRTIYVVSINSAGKLVSEPVIATPFIFGTVPVIESVTPGTEKLSVKFRQDQTGSTPITYYYSFLSDGSNAIGPIDTSFNFAETLPRTIYIVARNAAGDLISSGVSGTPFVYGSKPIITGLQPGLNRLTVSFTQTTQGTTPVQYYYSEFSNGSNRVGPVTSPFDISNIDTLKTVYIVADNSAGIVVSDASSATPYKLGTNPVVSAIVPGTNKLTVSFSQSSKGTEPVTYYYSELSDGTSRVGPVTSPFDISNILVSKTVYIIAENSGGTLISLSDASGTPYIFGTTSSITNVEPGTNSLTVSFNPSTGGTTPITNYYSYSSSGIPRVAQIQSGASTFTISGIYESKTVYIVSENPAGNLVSAGVSGTPYIFGQIPTISSVTPGTNKLVVNFSQSNKGTLPVTYYYSFNGSGRLGTVTTPSFEIATTVERTVYIIADNSAGTLVSEGVSGTPYIFGSALSVNLSSPISNTIRVSYSQATQGTTPTTYKYVLNGGSSVEVSTNPNGVFDISGLTGTSPYSVYMIASNAAGDLSSNTLTQPVLGTQPTISSVTPETNKLVVNFSQSNIGTLPVTYYYSFNGSVRLGTVTTPSFEIATTVERTVYIIADNSAGTLVSAGVSGTPYIVGVPPTVSIESGVNEITVYFSNTGGTAPITYYYSYESDGSTQIGPVTSPFNINNITTATTIYIVANNIAGTIISNAVTGIPYVVGSAPVINSIRSGTNSLIVDFSGSIGGVPSPYAYYYSLDEGNYVLARSLTSPITIEVMIEKQYTVRLIAQNAAGFTLPSNLEVGFPTYKQPILNINSSPPKDANADSGGSFAQNKFMFLKTYSPPPTTLENQQIQVKKKLIGSGRRSSEDVIRQRRIAAVGTSFNATGGDFSIMETSSNVTRRVKFRR